MGYKVYLDGEHEVIVYDDNAIQNALNYWNEERMKNAIPIDMRDRTSYEHTEVDVPNDLDVERADTSTAPYNACGKLFMTINGQDYVGSAQFCADSHLVLTAAHCVKDRDTGNYAENVVFKRVYNSMAYREQHVPIHSVALKGWWTTEETNFYRWDYAFGVTRSSCDVDYLEYKICTGSMSETAVSMGYPVNFYNGQYMVKTEGSYYKINYLSEPSQKSGRWNMPGNPMTGGASGGAWVDKNDNKVISVNSTCIEANVSLQAPIFTEDFESLVKYAKKLID